MTYHAQLASTLGDILLCSDGSHLTGLYFVGQEDCPAVAGLPPPRQTDPTAGSLSGMPLKRFKVYRQAAGTDLFSPDNLQRTAAGATGATGDTTAAPLCNAAPGPVRGRDHETLGPLRFEKNGMPAGARAVFEQAREELDDYFNHGRQVFSVPLLLQGTDFQKKVWKALLDIPYGHCASYGDVATAAGLTAQHGRPVGTAVGRNPVTIMVPCHRVLSCAGRLNGYTGGLERKFALLQLEGFTLA
jgi:methylated-DNA-[protein]-cysteine S-methyltransferase